MGINRHYRFKLFRYRKQHISGADPGFLERGFICIKVISFL